MNKVTIISAIARTNGITLYSSTGEPIELPAGGWRTRAIMDDITRPIARGLHATIDLDDYLVERIIEKKSGGLIRFFRDKWKSFTSHFVGQEDDRYKPDPESETLVAEINGVKIPGMEKISKQIEYAAFRDAAGFQKFLDRLSEVIDTRGHSVQELLTFMQKADMPIADDGTIVGYKVLNRGANDRFVDCHSGKVPQRVGSFVLMDETLVDSNRRLECSTGLHIARRQYVRGFHGSVLTLVKVAPEDVIAVPYGEPDKMRACGYHIVAELSENAIKMVRSGLSFTSDTEAARTLANVIAGDHAPVIEIVTIGSAKGGDISIETLIDDPVAADPVPEKDNGAAIMVDEVEQTDPVKVAEIRKIKKEEQIAATPVAGDYSHVPEKWREAYIKVATGELSQREAEKTYNVSAKKLRALIREFEGK